MYNDELISIEMKNKICFVNFKEGKIDKDEAKKIILKRIELIKKHGKLNTVCCLHPKTKMLKGARLQFGMKRGYIGINTIAIVLKKNRLLIDFLNLFTPKERKTNKPLTKIFNNEKHAISWIQQQISKEK